MRLLIIDYDADFRRRLSAYIAARCSDISITVCSVDALDSSVLQSADHVICDERSADEITDLIYDIGRSVTILAWDEDVHAKKAPASAVRVFKFQSAYGLVSSIPCISERMSISRRPDAGGAMRVIAVSGMTGGCGRTTFSLTLARMLRQKTGEGVLVISAEQMSDIYDYFTDEAKNSKADLNLLLLSYASGAQTDASRYIINDSCGVSCFRPPADRLSDLAYLTAAELAGFISYIEKWNIFGTVIFDCGCGFEGRYVSIYENADIVFMMHDDRRHPFGTEEAWRSRLEELVGGCTLKRILNFDISGGYVDRIFLEDDSLRARKVYDQCLPADPDSFFIKNGRADISMSGAYASAVEALCRGITHI